MKRTTLFLFAIAAALSFANQTTKPAAKAAVATLSKGVQRATIVVDNGRYNPATISVVKGKPVELTFKLGKSPGCGSTVVFKSLKFSKEVPKGKSIVVKFTPNKAGTVDFTCGMGMFHGKVLVK
ncbi:MAG: cupredoxin domain-containing protein [Armatimonadetes bacterium]|nr:cupredoxin domain-containing protein [Armatimonadota bacterium]